MKEKKQEITQSSATHSVAPELINSEGYRVATETLVPLSFKFAKFTLSEWRQSGQQQSNW